MKRFHCSNEEIFSHKYSYLKKHRKVALFKVEDFVNECVALKQ